MPLYEYECSGGHRFEEFKRMDDRNNVTCPECGLQAELRLSLSTHRFATPLTIVHNGKVVAKQRDPIIRPPPGEAYPVGG